MRLSEGLWTLSSIKYRVLIKYCVFSKRIFNILQSLPRQDCAAIGCTENGQLIGVIVRLDLKSEELLSHM